MGFRNPLNGVPPSSITADMLADDVLDGRQINGARLTAVQGLSLGPTGQEVTHWGWRLVSGPVDVDGQLEMAHTLGGAPSSVLTQLHDDSHDHKITVATVTPDAVTFQGYDLSGAPLPPGTQVRFYVQMLRGDA